MKSTLRFLSFLVKILFAQHARSKPTKRIRLFGEARGRLLRLVIGVQRRRQEEDPRCQHEERKCAGY